MNTRMIAVLAGGFTGGLLASAGSAFGQTVPDTGIVITVDHPTLLPGESTTVTMAAAWPESISFKVAGLLTDLNISTGTAGWSDVALIAPMDGPGTTPGVPTASGFSGIIAGQLHFPPLGGCPFGICPERPTMFWVATYTAPTEVESPFEVSLLTDTSRFDVYVDPDSSLSISVTDRVVEGSATIRVIPAPAGVLVVGVGLMVVPGRRRSRGLP